MSRFTHSPSARNSCPSSSMPVTRTRTGVPVAWSRSSTSRFPLVSRTTSLSRMKKPMSIGYSGVTFVAMPWNATFSDVPKKYGDSEARKSPADMRYCENCERLPHDRSCAP